MNAPSIAVTDRRAPDVLARARALVRALTDEPTTEARPVLDDQTVALARAEGLAPLLGARVGQGRVVVSSDRRAGLVWEHQMCLAAGIVRDRAAVAFAEGCRRSGIPLAWLKGMALVQGIFAAGERSMLDIDVLVPAALWGPACGIAAGLPGARELHVQGRRYTAAHDYVRAFAIASGVTIEVHRFVCESSLFGIDHDGLFARATPTSSGVSVLDEGDLFLTLAAHAAKHTFELPLRSFVDGVVLLHRGRLDPAALAERARRWRMEKAFLLWMQSLDTLAPHPARAIEAPASRSSPLAGLVWSRTCEVSAWQRFVRLAWIVDGPGVWAGHVLSRVGLRVRDFAQARQDDASA